MFRSSRALFLLVAVAVMVPAQARVRQIQFEHRWNRENERVEPQRYSGNQMSTLGQQRFSSGTWAAGSQMSGWQPGANRVRDNSFPERFRVPYRTPNQVPFSTASRAPGSDTRFLRNGDRSLVAGPDNVLRQPMHGEWNDQFRDFADSWAKAYQDEIDDGEPDLSLQDINRYQFRRSHSSEAGLPVQEAGGGSEPEG